LYIQDGTAAVCGEDEMQREQNEIMVYPEPLAAYLDLLKIRQSARRREVRILGCFFLISFLLMMGSGLIYGLGPREVYLVAGVNVALGLGFLMAWVRLEITDEMIELVNKLHVLGR
jgi:hypothetical protein